MKLFVGICNSQEYIHSRFFWSCLSMDLGGYECAFFQASHPWDVVRNNVMIKNFLDSGYDYFVKMDVDQIYPPNYFKAMVPLLEKYKVLGPLLFERHEERGFTPLVFENADYNNLKDFDVSGTNGIIRVPFAHTNLFYHQEVLKKIPAPWYEAHLQEDGLDRKNHVDFTFLQKVKDAGYSIYINMDLTVKHIANIGVDKTFFNSWQNGVNNDAA